jgi:hypothetical protein
VASAAWTCSSGGAARTGWDGEGAVGRWRHSHPELRGECHAFSWHARGEGDHLQPR